MANGGAIAGGALGGAGTGAAVGSVVPVIGTGLGAVGGALVGGLSSLFSSNKEEHDRKMQMMMRAADQRAAPWLAKMRAQTAITPYDLGQNHGADPLQGALAGFDQLQKGQSASKDNEIRDLMVQQLMGNNPKIAQAQSQALQGMPPVAAQQTPVDYDQMIKILAAKA